jgi:hypothetical protein
LSKEEIDFAQSTLQVKTLDESQLSVIKVRPIPHKNKFPSMLIQYECSQSFEELFKSDVESFFSMCSSKWNELHVEAKEKKDLFPIMWRMFTPKSHRKIMASVFDFYLSEDPRLKFTAEMEIRTFQGDVIKCFVMFMIQRYPEPYDFLPQSYTAIIAPLERKTMQK